MGIRMAEVCMILNVFEFSLKLLVTQMAHWPLGWRRGSLLCSLLRSLHSSSHDECADQGDKGGGRNCNEVIGYALWIAGMASSRGLFSSGGEAVFEPSAARIQNRSCCYFVHAGLARNYLPRGRVLSAQESEGHFIGLTHPHLLQLFLCSHPRFGEHVSDIPAGE